MSMRPIFPPLRPRIANPVWFESSQSTEESDLVRYEREHHAWLETFKTAANDIPPIGKVLTNPGIETDEEDANDESDDTDSHDGEDEETNERIIPGQGDLYSPADEGEEIRNTLG